MKTLSLLLVLLILTFNASAQTFKSEFGFSVDLSDDWLTLNTQNSTAANKKKTLEKLGKLNIKTENAEKILNRIATANVEFIFDTKNSDNAFNNNISLQRGAGSTARTGEQAEAACKTLEPELKKLYKEKITITQCGMIDMDQYSFMSYEYNGAIAGVTTIQHEFQITPNLTFISIGGTKEGSLERIRDTQMKIARAVIKHIKASPDYFAISEKAVKALQDKKYKTAFKQLKILADVGDPEGLFNLAAFYEHGKSTKKDLKKAFQLYNEAAQQGHRHAITKLGDFHLNGKATKKNEDIAARMFFQAGAMGDPVAQNSFATMLFNGIGVKEKDPAKAIEWFAQSAQQGYPPAARNLIKIYEAEIESKNIKAYHPLAMIYLQGAGVKQDTDKAMEMLEKAAFDGVAESRKALHEIYSKGLFGVPKNEEKANAWK